MIPIKNPEAIKRMREACAVAATVLSRLREQVRPGITTHDLDQIGRDLIASFGARSACHSYQLHSRRYPAYTCLSVNEEVVHGIGSLKRILRDGDIISLDVVVEYNGYIGDNALTVPVGTIAPRTAELLKVTAEALSLGIAQATVGNRIGDISHTVQTFVEAHGFSVVREMVGHGVGRAMHEEPQIPNFGRRMFAEGAFSQAFVPVFTEVKTTGTHDEARDMVAVVMGTLGGVLSLVTIIGCLGAPLLVWLFASGFASNPTQAALGTELLRWTFPYLMFISLTSMAGGVLNAYGKFAVPAFTPVILNVCLIATAFIDADSVQVLAYAVFVAGILQFAFQLPLLLHLRLLPRPRWAWGDGRVKRILGLMIPVMVGSSIAQISLLLNTNLSTHIGNGSVSWLYYANRLMEFPLGIFSIAVGTAILPALSAQYAKKTPDEIVAFCKAWSGRVPLVLVPTSYPQLDEAAARSRLSDLKKKIAAGQADFAAAAREISQDGSAAQGGDLGWANPGMFVPEFEETMNRLAPGQISDPLVSRFGVHLIQMMERRNVAMSPKEQQETVRAMLREKKFEDAYVVWAQDIRGRAYVEIREPPAP